MAVGSLVHSSYTCLRKSLHSPWPDSPKPGELRRRGTFGSHSGAHPLPGSRRVTAAGPWVPSAPCWPRGCEGQPGEDAREQRGGWGGGWRLLPSAPETWEGPVCSQPGGVRGGTRKLSEAQTGDTLCLDFTSQRRGRFTRTIQVGGNSSLLSVAKRATWAS